VAAGVAASLLVQFPLRCFQVENFVRPFAHADEVFHKADADLLVFDPILAFYSHDLRRNDPFLRQRPIILTSLRIRQNEAAALARTFPRTRFIGKEELRTLGLATQHAAGECPGMLAFVVQICAEIMTCHKLSWQLVCIEVKLFEIMPHVNFVWSIFI